MTRLDDPDEADGAQEPPQSPRRFPLSHAAGRLSTWLRSDRRRLAGATVAALVSIAALAGVIYVVASGDGGGDNVVQQPTPTPGPSRCSQPVLIEPLSADGPSDWEDLDLPPADDCFRMTAGEPGDRGIPPDASFVMEALEPVDVADLASRLAVEPDIEFDIEALTDSQTGLAPGRSQPAASRFRIQPKTPLAEDTLYRFTLLDKPGGVALGAWAFQTQRPLRIVQTLPADQATYVPLNIGIELTFSHDGVTGVEDNFVIEPAVEGRFETHKRTMVFVPKALEAGTLYTVTVGPDVGIQGSALTLGQPHVFQFETGADERTGATPVGPPLLFTRRVWESATGEKPALAVFSTYYSGNAPKPVDTPLPFTVYALGDQPAFLDAVDQFSAAPSWAQIARARLLLDTSGLQVVTSFESTVAPTSDGADYYVIFPDVLPAGYYLVQTVFDEHPTQALLQVTDVATYISVSQRALLVWANDVASKAPLAGASVAVAGSTPAATTGADGVALFDSPEGLVELSPSPWGYTTRETVGNLIITAADGRSAVVPLADIFNGYRYFGFREYSFYGDPGIYWHYLYTDRHLYRMTDSVHFWGVVREREGPPAPLDVTIEITGTQYGDNGSYREFLIARTSVQTTDAGTFIGELPLKGVSPGYYQMKASVGDQVVESAYLEVQDFVKPAYQIEVVPEKKAIFAGESTDVTIRATFFDGAPVPNLELTYNEKTDGGTVTTNAAGEVVVPYSSAVTPDGGYSGYGPYISAYLTARPVAAEEGEITGNASVLVFPSAVALDATPTFDTGTGTLSGTVYNVDLSRINSGDLVGYTKDPYGSPSPDYRGPPAPGREVTATVTETSYAATEIGDYYDFIAKIVRKRYRYDEVRTPIGTFTAVSGADGGYQISFPAAPSRSYQADITVRDDADRRHLTQAWLYTGSYYSPYDQGPQLANAAADTCSSWKTTWTKTCLYGPGDQVSVAMQEQNQDLPTGGDNRYLFYLAQNGIRSYGTQDNPRYSFTFAEEHIPNVAVVSARFNGHTYQEVSFPYTAAFDSSLRELTITVTPDRERYGPGERATLDVVATGKDGQPMQAEVLLSAIDEAAFSLDANAYYYETDILQTLYKQISSGVLHTYASHQYPYAADAGAERGGDGPRDNFKDTALFDRVVTDAQGHGSISFDLPDNLTSWRVTALAVSPDLYAGVSVSKVPVSLPVFVDVTMNTSYLTTDLPHVKMRAFGTALGEGDPVSFELSSATLLPQALTATGTAFESVDIPLPPLTEGRHEVTFKVTGAGQTDALVRTVTVLPSRLLRSQERYYDVQTGGSLTPEGAAAGMTQVTISDFNRGRYYPALRSLSWTWGDRVDQMLARNLSQRMLEQYFGEASAFPAEFRPSAYQKPEGGIAIFPFADVDLVLSARVAALAPEEFGRQGLIAYFQTVLDDPAETRERVIVALFGMAELGEPVLPTIQALAAENDLSVREQLYLGLAAADLGDLDTARVIYRGLLDQYGQRRGPDARLKVGEDQDDILETTSLAAELGASLADNHAPLLFGYTQGNWTTDILVQLDQISYLSRVMPNLSAAPVHFAYTYQGERREETLDRGNGLALLLSPEELAGLDLQSIEGVLGVTSSFLAPFDPASVEPDPDVSITRTYSGQAGDHVSVQEGDIVEITLSFNLGPQAIDGCYQITDTLPSGMRPTSPLYAWSSKNTDYPYNIEGQRVSYCVYKDSRKVIIYHARVIGTGDYTAEPAIIQSQRAPESLAVTGAMQVQIR